jgi:hypothetical protein
MSLRLPLHLRIVFLSALLPKHVCLNLRPAAKSRPFCGLAQIRFVELSRSHVFAACRPDFYERFPIVGSKLLREADTWGPRH